MSERYAILCPGQGGQHSAMFDLLRKDARGASTLQAYALDARLGIPLDAVLSDDRLLFANRCAQPLMVAAGLAVWHILHARLPPPELVAGYSIGELTAYGVAEALSPAAAIDLAVVRAACMDACLTPTLSQGLMSVGGIAVAEAQRLLQSHGVFVAIETGFDTLIAGGHHDGLNAAQRQLASLGARTGMLPVGLASHTPLMQEAVTPFSAALDAAAFKESSISVLAGVSGQEVHDSDGARSTLAQQLTHTVRWSACMDACVERGIGFALELGPGAALSRMLRERHPYVECRSVSEFRSLEAAADWLQERIE